MPSGSTPYSSNRRSPSSLRSTLILEPVADGDERGVERHVSSSVADVLAASVACRFDDRRLQPCAGLARLLRVNLRRGEPVFNRGNPLEATSDLERIADYPFGHTSDHAERLVRVLCTTRPPRRSRS